MKKIKLKITHIIAASWPRASKGFLYRSAEVACPRKVLEDVDADLPGRFPKQWWVGIKLLFRLWRNPLWASRLCWCSAQGDGWVIFAVTSRNLMIILESEMPLQMEGRGEYSKGAQYVALGCSGGWERMKRGDSKTHRMWSVGQEMEDPLGRGRAQTEVI